VKRDFENVGLSVAKCHWIVMKFGTLVEGCNTQLSGVVFLYLFPKKHLHPFTFLVNIIAIWAENLKAFIKHLPDKCG